MKITSRPSKEAEDIAGSGPFTLHMTLEQLQFVAAMCYNTRLGGGVYSKAAFELMEVFDTEIFDADFCEAAASIVGMKVSINGDDPLAAPLAVFTADELTVEV